MLDLVKLQERLSTRQRRVLELPEFRKAAVLVAIRLEPEPCLILTQRTTNLSTQSGQIAFAGGSLDPAETPIQAALRESHEEIGLEPSLVKVLGLLDDVWTPAGFHVVPVVGLVSSAAVLRPNPAEVAKILYVPIADLQLLTPIFEQKTLPASARVPDFETRVRAVPHYYWHGIDIWGMTAFVIQGLLKLS